MTDGAHSHATDPAIVAAIGAETTRATAAESSLAARIAKLEAASPPVVVPPPVVTPPTGAPSWWIAPVANRTVQLPPSIDATGAADITAAFKSFISGVPDGSLILGAGPGATYKHTGSLILGVMSGRTNLIFDGQGATLNNIAPAASSTASNEASAFYWSYAQKPFPSHLTFRNWVAKAANPTPGKMNGSEFAAFVHSMGGHYVELNNITASGLFGDLLTLNEDSQFVWSHGNHMIDCGRNSVSVVCGSHVVVEDSAHDVAGYCSFDIEPEPTSIAGSADITYRRNSHISYGTDIFFALDGVDAGKALSDIVIDSNTITGKSITVSAGGTKPNVRPQRLTFTNNAGPAGGNVAYRHIDGLTHKGNTQGGKLLSATLTDCPNPVLG